MKKVVLSCMLITLLLTCGGCATVKNTTECTAKGVVSLVAGPFYGFSTGVTEDIKNTSKTLKKADDWVVEYLW